MEVLQFLPAAPYTWPWTGVYDRANPCRNSETHSMETLKTLPSAYHGCFKVKLFQDVDASDNVTCNQHQGGENVAADGSNHMVGTNDQFGWMKFWGKHTHYKYTYVPRRD